MKSPIKIALSGSHSTGKSTFLDALARDLEGMGLRVGRVSDLACDARSKGFGILRDHTIESTLWIMSKCMANESEMALVSDVILVDRPVFDAVCYLEAALNCTGKPVDRLRLDLLRQLATSYTREYLWLGVTRLDRSLPLGPGRDQDLEFREMVARRVEDWAGDLKIDRVVTSANADAMRADALESVKRFR